MKFIDLFSGLGGFHVGLSKHGHQCVFSCELDESLRELYKINHDIVPHDDIRTVKEDEIPEHDILCAGFPCQPFSLAGKKKGAKCPDSGKLIDHVLRIVQYHQPKYIFLENVPNVITIEDGAFWDYLKNSFESLNYRLEYKIISPTDIGIPQNRKRVFIVGKRNDLVKAFEWPKLKNAKKNDFQKLLNDNFEHKKLEPQKVQLLEKWQELLDVLNLEEITGVSIVAPEFGADYPLDFSNLTLEEIKKYKGAYGKELKNCKNWDEVLSFMPSYTKKNFRVASWITKSIIYSRGLYKENTKACEEWKIGFHFTNNSWQILEWRGLRNNPNIFNHLVQFRASGIRILKSNIAPSLIAMTPTQIPVIPSQNRYVSTQEAAKLQYLHKLKALPNDRKAAFKALGNAVNAKIVELISYNLV
ncbi:hypothetical protein F959_01633 [Acinetobacter venetianus RAG-1 = CIP 110063]|uniref:Cytosine-specific methyltransferase n=1 Tax=Acinetobacter venetianus (strain ATCC 31012 / DSM 23050 / BCRC 14357 / CCUG 45561 / CIP 110063 / KCTC 2702 / LMG 19082 / RAG-1) TaxID=1191460 RepID=N9A186_ACIVR|nr:DNA (cytosine-5-)-methyltransferase [Acinetobacter venetianus]ENV37510.1 hypothetical protein F959_01633 [Acinetobacter venetianus RAG-1 = CIP 110063]